MPLQYRVELECVAHPEQKLIHLFIQHMDNHVKEKQSKRIYVKVIESRKTKQSAKINQVKRKTTKLHPKDTGQKVFYTVLRLVGLG